jgi:DNA modification methylase
MKQYTLLHGDCLELLKTLPDNSVDSIVTDPPYELGFMGKKWDSTGIAYSVEMWSECLRVLNHGGHLLAFGGTRTYHRMACAIEDAGFEVRDMIEWVYGSGFPKSLNVGKAVDKLQGNEREKLNERGGAIQKGSVNWQGQDRKDGKGSGFKEKFVDTKGTSEWEGWGTALKPAHEPVCMARKPLAEKTVAQNVLKYGTGGINIDESRVGTEDNTGRKNSGAKGGQNLYGDSERYNSETHSQGRFPANLIHDNSEEVRECFPETKSGSGNKNTGNRDGIFGKLGKGNGDGIGGDSGNASRFFKSIIYAAKASKADRGNGNTHATVKPNALMAYLIKMVTRQGGIVLDPFMGSGTTGVAAVRHGFGFIGIEKESDHFEICKARIERDVKQQCERGELDLPHKQLTLF